MTDLYSQFKCITLENGLKVYVLEVDKPFEIVRFIIHTGSFDESALTTGIAHFVEHAICAASGKTVSETVEFFGEEGADFTAFTNGHSTVYGFDSPITSSLFQEFMNFFGNAFFRLSFDKIIERERATIMSEFGTLYQSDAKMAFKIAESASLLKGTVWAGRLGALGTKPSVESTTLADLHSFRAKCYVPQNMSVIFAGGLNVQQLLKMLDQSGFSEKTTQDGDFVRQPIQSPKVPSTNKLVENLSHGSTSYSTHVLHCLVKTTLPAISMYTRILNLLLMNELRGKQRSLVYGASSGYTNYRDFFDLTLHANHFPPEHEALVLKIMRKQITEVAYRDDIFAKIKKSGMLSFSRHDETLEDVCIRTVNDLSYFGKIKTLKDQMDDMLSVTFDEVLMIIEQMKRNRWLNVLERN